MSEAVQTPALIERHTPLSGPPFFSVSYLRSDDPAEWTPRRVEAAVLDYMAASTRALALEKAEPAMGHVFASTALTPTHRAQEIAPRHRSAREDWRAHAANCGVE